MGTLNRQVRNNVNVNLIDFIDFEMQINYYYVIYTALIYFDRDNYKIVLYLAYIFLSVEIFFSKQFFKITFSEMTRFAWRFQ